jgi:ubiquitin C-terminal hydrolase
VPVTYPTGDTQLDMRPYSHGRTHAAARYRLYAVVDHLGQSINAGHYIAKVKAQWGGALPIANVAANSWWRADDETVTPLLPDAVHDPRAVYMLFYERCPVEV